MAVEHELKTIRNMAAENEQYSRKNNIKIYGLEEEKGEECVQKIVKLLKDKLNIQLYISDISAAHRIPGGKNGPRPLVVKLVHSTVKNKILIKRKLLKGSGIVIREDISIEYVKLMNRMENKDNVDSVWFWSGKVFVKTTDGNKRRVKLGDII